MRACSASVSDAGIGTTVTSLSLLRATDTSVAEAAIPVPHLVRLRSGPGILEWPNRHVLAGMVVLNAVGHTKARGRAQVAVLQNDSLWKTHAGIRLRTRHGIPDGSAFDL